MHKKKLITVFFIALLFVGCSPKEIKQSLTLKDYTIGDSTHGFTFDNNRIVGGVQGVFWLTDSENGVLKGIRFEATTDKAAAIKCINGFKTIYDYKYEKAYVDTMLKTDSIFAYHNNNKLIAYTYYTNKKDVTIQLILEEVPDDYVLRSEFEALKADY